MLSKMLAIAAPLRVTRPIDAVSIDPFVDSSSGCRPRGVGDGIAASHAGCGEAVSFECAHHALNTSERVRLAPQAGLAIAEEIGDCDSAAPGQQPVDLCEDGAQVGHQRDHAGQKHDVGEGIWQRRIVSGSFENVEVWEGAARAARAPATGSIA